MQVYLSFMGFNAVAFGSKYYVKITILILPCSIRNNEILVYLF